MPAPNRRRGFTLIELLVVVTIIVVLLALLVPAMDKAIYQAELTMCGTNLHAAANGSLIYAAGNKRSFPYRVVSDLQLFNYEIKSNITGTSGVQGRYDDRPPLAGYVELKTLVDPMCNPVDLSRDAPASDGIHVIDSSYSIWWGWQYKSNGQTGGMTKISDRWTWTEDVGTANAKRHRFNWLIGDLDLITPEETESLGSHPDSKGLLEGISAEVGEYEQNTANQQYNALNPGIAATYSFWRTRATHQRGTLDMNFAASDGSVQRFTEVGAPNIVGIPEDERVIRVGAHGSNTRYTTTAPR